MPEHKPISANESAAVRQFADYLIDIRLRQPMLVNAEGKVEIDTTDYIDPIWREWRKMAELRAIKNGSEAEGILLKRASVIAWRATVLYWLLWELQTDALTLQRLHDAFFWTADIVLREQLALFGRQLEAVQLVRKRPVIKNVFDMLPATFTTDDVHVIVGRDTPRANIWSRIHYWKTSGLITKKGKNFMKLA